MANVKQFHLIGKVPFDIAEKKECQVFLAHCASPTLDMKIKYGSRSCEYKPNQYGGQTAMYHFELDGREALRIDYFRALVKAFRDAGAVIEVADVYDVEGYSSPTLVYHV